MSFTVVPHVYIIPYQYYGTTYFIPPKSMNNELTYGSWKKNVELSQTLGFVLGIIHINYLSLQKYPML